MSAIAAVVGGRTQPPAERAALVGAMVAGGVGRSDELPRTVGEGTAVVGAAARREAGERCLIHAADGLLVVADAALVRREALRASLDAAGMRPLPDDDDAALIAAAWRAFGRGLGDHLDGDYAAIIVDERRGVCLAIRDSVGRRPLHWARSADGALLVGSTAGVIVAHPGCPRALDRAALAAMAAGLFEDLDETAYAAVRVVPAGHLLIAEDGGAPRLHRFWSPPPFETSSGIPFEAAAEELRLRLVAAVAERVTPQGDGLTAVWLSGGWDSTAVYGAAAGRHTVRAVSMSYPVGDGGREDEMIAAVAGHWGDTPEWVRIGDVPLLPPGGFDLEAGRDEPFAHAYDGWNAAMARASRALGARVVLDGAGGDQLFSATPVFLADLVRRGRWGAAAREARSHGVTAGTRRAAAWSWWRWGVRPLMPPVVRDVMGLLRSGRAPLGHLERPIPPWIRPGAEGVAGLHRRARGFVRRSGESASAAETRWYLTTPYAGRILAAQSGVALAEGVVIRSPLLDRWVVELAASRPREERAGAGETKRLLRAAVRGLVPASVLATRSSRTGLSSDYFRRELDRHLPRLMAAAAGCTGLAELGVVEPAALRRAADEWMAGRLGDDLGLALLLTLRTELWVRGRMR